MAGMKRFRPILLLFATAAACWTATVAPARDVAPDDSPEALFQSGMSRYNGGDYEGSLEFLSELIKVFGREPELRERMDLAMFAKACALYNLERHEDAVKAFEQLLKEFPKTKYADEAVYRIALCDQQLDDLSAAIAAFQRLLRDYPSSPFAEDSAFQIGFCHLSLEDNAAAAAAFADFQERFPNSRLAPQAAAYRARALFDDDKPLDAIAVLRESEARPRPWSVVTFCNFLAFEIGDALFDEGEYDDALTAYRRVKTRKAILRNLRDELSALEAEKAALDRRPVSAQTMSAQFRAARYLSREIAQHRDLLSQLEAMPDYDEGLYHRIGRCYFNTDRYWPARVAFARVVGIATDPDVKEAAHFDLILCISRLRRFDDLLVEADAYLSTYDPKGQWE